MSTQFWAELILVHTESSRKYFNTAILNYDFKNFVLHALGTIRLKILQNREKTSYACAHKVRLYKEYHSVCPLVGIGTLPPPLSPASVPLPPEPGGRGTLACGRRVGEVPIRRLEKKLTLCLRTFHFVA